MSMRIVLWYAVLAATALFAMRRGGGPERFAAAMMVAASIATTIVPLVPATYRAVVWPLALIDMALLGALVAMALVADRFWPLYLAAAQLLTVAVHGVRAIDESILPLVYFRVVGQLAYPTLLILAIGTWRHARRGTESDWAWQVRPGALAGGLGGGIGASRC